jgi:4-amino-4-deoxychorismate lyase
MSNLFLVHDGHLMTPALEHCGVRGVMRSVVLEQASAAAIETAESSCPAELLDDAEEVFVTNSLIGMRPVVRMAERRLDIGPITRVIARRLAACGVMEAGF